VRKIPSSVLLAAPSSLRPDRRTGATHAGRNSWHRRPSASRRAFDKIGGIALLEDNVHRNAPHLADPFLDRVRHSYRLSLGAHLVSRGHIWDSIDKLRASVHEALMAPGLGELRAIFANPVISDLNYGFDRMSRTLVAPMTTAEARAEAEEAEVERCRQQVVRLSEALGLRRWLPSEGEHASSVGSSDHDLFPRIEDLLSAASEEVGFEIQFPNPLTAELGLKTSRGVASFRALQAVYQAHRLAVELHGSPCSKILEIGPGAGRTAFYAKQAGLKNYTTVDLPLGVVAQAWFLGATLGPDAIWMIGDQSSEMQGKIRLFPSTIPLPEEETFALVLNVDSITEMDSDSAAGYLEYAATHSGIFISINHEANAFTVANLVRKLRSRAEYRRSPYFMRNGYVEEVLRFVAK